MFTESLNEIIQKLKQTNNLWIIILLILLAVVLTFGLCFAIVLHKHDPKVENKQEQEFIVYDYDEQKLKYAEQQEKQKLKDLQVSDEEIAVSDNQPENLVSQMFSGNGTMVTMNVRTGGRSNPFAPYFERSISSGGFVDIAEPPEYIPDEPVAEDLMQTTVSGILYSNDKSNAIINVDGTDQLVSKGDKIAGFQIVNITRTKVYVKKGSNIIAAGVGETIEEPELTYNSVYNLQKKFGGTYAPAKKGVILINGQQY